MSVMKFDPAGMVLMNLGRRDEGPDEPHYRHANPPPTPADALFNDRPTSRGTLQDNIYVGDGYFNSRIAKFDKDGNWIKQWGEPGGGGVHANENPGHISNPHNIGIDRQQNVYVADRGNRRIQVSIPTATSRGSYSSMCRTTDASPCPWQHARQRPDETQPWTICITNTPTQYLYTSDSEPGRIYKLSLPDGKILGVLGKSGHVLGQFNWVHGLACPDENTLYVADMNNWRVQKLILHPDKQKQIISNK